MIFGFAIFLLLYK